MQCFWYTCILFHFYDLLFHFYFVSAPNPLLRLLPSFHSFIFSTVDARFFKWTHTLYPTLGRQIDQPLPVAAPVCAGEGIPVPGGVHARWLARTRKSGFCDPKRRIRRVHLSQGVYVKMVYSSERFHDDRKRRLKYIYRSTKLVYIYNFPLEYDLFERGLSRISPALSAHLFSSLCQSPVYSRTSYHCTTARNLSRGARCG